jgi:predicted transcriptional regulator
MKTRIIKNSGLYIEVGKEYLQALEKQLGLRE